MSLNKELIKKSKLLALLLRHKPETIGLELDANGWASVDFLIKSGKGLTLALIQEIVQSDDKGRYELSKDGKKLRAVHGHSVDVDTLGESTEPPEVLYHGTASKTVTKILKEGLKPMKRKNVHLSSDKDAAIMVGKRYGNPVVLKVRARSLFSTGHYFFESSSDIWLTDHIPPEFIEVEW